MKNKDTFFSLLREYLSVYLPEQRRSSPHTIASSRQAWSLLLGYLRDVQGVRPEGLTFKELSREAVTGFLDHMETTRSWSAATRNQRLGSIRGFFKYATAMDPINMIHLEALSSIPRKQGPDKSSIVDFMSENAMKTLLGQPDPSKRLGMRDQFFMILMYDTAARDCEMLGMRLCDFDGSRRTISVIGKGSKHRMIPITPETVLHFNRYVKEFHCGGDPQRPLFYTTRNGISGTMSDDNVARFIKGHAASARQKCSEVPETVHPHMFRHSRSMHLYKGGMPLALLSELLGHSDPSTTFMPARTQRWSVPPSKGLHRQIPYPAMQSILSYGKMMTLS